MKKIFIVFFFLVVGIKSWGQEDKFKALFLYNFTKYLEWPTDIQNPNFTIGVFGPSPIIQELEIIAGKKNVGNLPIVIKRIEAAIDAEKCNILFIPEGRSSRIKEFEKCNTRGILIITDKEGLAKTFSGINYVKLDGKQTFEINKKNIENKGIKVNSALLSLGIEIK